MSKLRERKNRTSYPLPWRGTLPKVIVITGPTASGKTALALKLARKFKGEIISADSRQIYRGMNIGTAKPAPSPYQGEGWGEVLVQGIRHHLINIRNPNQIYTLAHFQRDALKIIKQIQKRRQIPFLVGGTALYINALINNLKIPQVKPNPALRRKLEKISTNQLYLILKQKDRRRAKTIDPHNKRRLIRALEIIEVLGHVPPLTPSPLQGEGGGEVLLFGLKKSEPALHLAIGKRTTAMFKAGLVREVKKLIKKYGRRKLFLDTIGYREIIDYLYGRTSLDKARELISLHTWQFTRRQMNWFRRLPVKWITTPSQAEHEIKLFLR